MADFGQMAREIALRNPLICGPRGGQFPNPDCPHKGSDRFVSCIPASDSSLEAEIAAALCRTAERMRERCALWHDGMAETWWQAAHKHHGYDRIASAQAKATADAHRNSARSLRALPVEEPPHG